jgi:hypothetical protein
LRFGVLVPGTCDQNPAPHPSAAALRVFSNWDTYGNTTVEFPVGMPLMPPALNTSPV